MPVRNERRYIGRSLRSVLEQDYPADCIEVLVVDGMSDDGTRDIVGKLAADYPQVRLLDNARRIVPTAMNIGLRHAKGDVIVRLDGHCYIAPDYIRLCVGHLSQGHAACVGGPIRTEGESLVARSIAIAMSSPFGVGNAAFRYAQRACYVDTLAFGAYPKEVFERIGLFDEELVRNQDDEFNFRLCQAQGKILLVPAIRSVYYSRATLRDLCRQYFQYGFWKVRVIQKRGRPASWRHLVPALFVLFLLLAGFITLATGQAVWLLAALGPYVASSGLASGYLAIKHGWRYLPLLPLVFFTLHLSYGAGFLCGVIKFGVLSLYEKTGGSRRA